ncbi:MAG: tetratricopeptide repeat protein [Bdellovibrionia bacterium]
MRIKLVRKLTKSLFFIYVTLSLCSCTSQEQRDYSSAQSETKKGHFRIALNHYEKVIKRNKSEELVVASLKEAARIAEFEIKDAKRAIEFYKQLVSKSPDHQERVFAQRQIADLTFNNLQNYEESVTELSKLISFLENNDDKNDTRLNLARSYFYLNNQYQALSEIDYLLKQNITEELRFSALQLKGNIFLADKKFLEAISVFTELTEENPEKAFQEKIGLTLAVCYEEALDYKNAIKTLESYLDRYQPREYIELRIKRLLERQKNAPGARGYRM